MRRASARQYVFEPRQVGRGRDLEIVLAAFDQQRTQALSLHRHRFVRERRAGIAGGFQRAGELQATEQLRRQRPPLELIARRAEGEPIAYIRGFKDWFSLRVATDARVWIAQGQCVETYGTSEPKIVKSMTSKKYPAAISAITLRCSGDIFASSSALPTYASMV